MLFMLGMTVTDNECLNVPGTEECNLNHQHLLIIHCLEILCNGSPCNVFQPQLVDRYVIQILYSHLLLLPVKKGLDQNRQDMSRHLKDYECHARAPAFALYVV